MSLSMESRVEGSVSYGGIQPDYEISDGDPELKDFLDRVAIAVKKNEFKDFLYRERKWAQINKVVRLIRETLPIGSYNSDEYISLLESYRSRGGSIPLGKYIECGAGVCRENGLLTHLALNKAQIENKYVYVKVRVGSTIEDHAFVVVVSGDHLWIVDPYNSYFHGKDLTEITEGGFARSKAPFVFKKSFKNVNVLEINSYPKYWVLKKCADVF